MIVSTPLITWCVVVAILLAAVIVSLAVSTHRRLHQRRIMRPAHRLIEIGNERDEFFIPGDIKLSDKDFGYDDFDDSDF